jgi:MFS family permease
VNEHDAYLALRSPDFRKLLGGSVLASLGSEMQAVAIGWELYERTGREVDLGYVGLAQFLPVLLLALPAGHAVDRYGRKVILVGSLALMTLSMLGLFGLSLVQGPILLIYLCLVLVGIARAFNAPARWSLIPVVVPAEALNNAVAWNASAWQTASVAGPALGGLVIAWAGRATPVYAIAAGCALICAVLLASIRPVPLSAKREAPTLASFLAGAGFVWRTRLILATMTLDMFAVLLGGATALLPVYAKDILDVGPTGLGWLRAAPSLGSLAMGITLAHRPPLRRAGRALLGSVACFGLATVGFGLSRDPLLSFVLLALTGAFDNVSMVVRGTLVHRLTPDPLRGRVLAVNSIFIVSSNELGAFESGVTAQWFGPVASVVGGGVGTILVVLAVMVRWPEVLRLGPLHSVEAEQVEKSENLPKTA